MKSGPSRMFYAVFISSSSIGKNQKSLKWSFEKGHMKSGASSMVLIYSIY